MYLFPISVGRARTTQWWGEKLYVILSAAKDLKGFAEVRVLRHYTVLSVEIPRRLGMTRNGCSNHHFAYKKTVRMQSIRTV